MTKILMNVLIALALAQDLDAGEFPPPNAPPPPVQGWSDLTLQGSKNTKIPVSK